MSKWLQLRNIKEANVANKAMKKATRKGNRLQECFNQSCNEEGKPKQIEQVKQKARTLVSKTLGSKCQNACT